MESNDPRPDRRRRQQLTMWLTCAALLIGAVLLLTLPGPLPWPLRIGLAATDLIVAATLWLVGCQHFGRHP